MIDFHTHILPNIDDGSRNIKETFNLIQEAKQVGFESIILTPHYIEGYYETHTREREVWLNAIYEDLKTKNIDINLYLGNEIYLTENIIKLLEEGKATTINNTNYVLFELPMHNEPLNLYNIIYEIMQYKLVPVLAHPERYSFVQKEPELVYDLVKKGVLMQCNYGSIIGQYGEKAQTIVKKLLENNLVHFLGSDVHRENTIYPLIPEALKRIEEITGKEKLEKMTTENPQLVLRNKRIDIDEPNKIKLTLKEKIMMETGIDFDGITKKLFKKQ